MSNPIISFRLSKFHLARALHIIRQFEPAYVVQSPAHIVKSCFFDYIAKMNLNRSPEIPTEIVIEIENLFSNPPSNKTQDLSSFIDNHYYEPEKPDPSKSGSIISSVSDFSPPDDWKE